MSKSISCIGEENCGNPKISFVIQKTPKRLWCKGKNLSTSHDHSINIKQKSKIDVILKK